MKLKKLFAGVVAAAMMLTMAVPAFAADSIDYGKSHHDLTDNTVTVEKSYVLNGVGTSPDETFNFDIKNKSVSDAAQNVVKENMPTPKVSGAAYTDGKIATDKGTASDITIDFKNDTGNLIYTSVGVYKYTITEIVPETPTAGVTYDEVPVEMTVTVVNGDEDGMLKILTVSFRKNDKKITGTGDEPAFTNYYTASTLNIKKLVEGSMGDKSKDFDFTVSFEAPDGTAWTQNSTLKLSYEQNAMTIGNNEASFTLSHKDEATIINLPQGVTFTIVEDAESADGYTTRFNDDTTDSANRTLVGSASGTKEGDSVIVHNIKGGEIDTGVILDNAPYILMLAVVAAGAMTLVIKKRREEE